MPKQVLIVDDDRNAVKFLSVVLSEHGYDPVAAHDGAEGLEKVKQNKPDLIVLDVMMPKKSGFVLFKQLKKEEQYKDIPVLMITGVSGLLEEMERRGKEDTFERPYDSLRESLRKAIKKMREEGLERPEKFVDKPNDPDELIVAVKELIGEP